MKIFNFILREFFKVYGKKRTLNITITIYLLKLKYKYIVE